MISISRLLIRQCIESIMIKRYSLTDKIWNCNVSTRGGTRWIYGTVLWHPPCRSEGARGPIIAESGESPWLHPGSRGRDAPQLEDSLVAEYLLYSSRKGQSAVQRLVRGALARFFYLVCPCKSHRENSSRPGNLVIWTRRSSGWRTWTRTYAKPQVTSSKTSDDLEDRYLMWNDAKSREPL